MRVRLFKSWKSRRPCAVMLKRLARCQSSTLQVSRKSPCIRHCNSLIIRSPGRYKASPPVSQWMQRKLCNHWYLSCLIALIVLLGCDQSTTARWAKIQPQLQCTRNPIYWLSSGSRTQEKGRCALHSSLMHKIRQLVVDWRQLVKQFTDHKVCA